jgi:signal transduction histidine kinase
LTLVVLFITLAEIFIFVPTVARYREAYLLDRLDRAQTVSMALLTSNYSITKDLETILLRSADVESIVLMHQGTRQLMLSTNQGENISASYDMRDPNATTLMRDAITQLLDKEETTIRVLGTPSNSSGLLLEITLPTAPLRAAMMTFSIQIFLTSAILSGLTAALLFFSVRSLLVIPIQRVVRHMTAYAKAPEDSTRIIAPTNTVRELREAESALQSLQTQLTASLRHRERLAQLGEAVAKISHDLRNILSVTSLMADRLEASADPAVQRATPKILASLTRAVNLTEATLAFGKAQEPTPTLTRLNLRTLADDVIDNDRLMLEVTDQSSMITYDCAIDPAIVVRADTEQLHRVLSNLVKNAREAILATGKHGTITLQAQETDTEWRLALTDTGPGLPTKAREHLFQPFQGAARKGGTGLGLAIAAELLRGHGGTLMLEKSTPEGTIFVLTLPKGMAH